MKKKLLSLCIASISATFGFNYAVAEEAVIYVDGTDSSELSAIIDNQLHFFDDNGVAVLDLPAGEYTAILKNDDALLGEVTFKVSELKQSEVKVIKSLSGLKVTQEQFSPDDDTQEGLVIGRVFMSGGESPLAGAKIRIEGINREVITDASGAYSLSVPRGNHTVFISHPEYAERKIENVRIVSGVATEASLSLAKVSAGIMEEVLILGVRGPADESSLAIERDASSVVSAITAEDFKKFGDSKASDALKRVSGVSVVGGQFAVVRGLAGRYISTTLDGGYLPSTDTTRRDVTLDLFPSTVLGGIAISKSFTAELPADSTGGHVGMTLKGVPTEFVSSISAKIEHNSSVTGKDFLTYSGGDNDSIGVDDGTRDMPSLLDEVTNYGQNPLPPACPESFLTPGCVAKEELASLGKSLPNNLEVYTKKAPINRELSYAYGDTFGDFGIYTAFDYKNKWNNQVDAQYKAQNFSNTGLEDARITDYNRSVQSVDVTGYLALAYDNGSDFTLKSKTTLLRKTTDTTTFRNDQNITEGRESQTATLEWIERQMFSQSILGENLLGDSDQHVINWLVSYAKVDRDEPDRRTYSYLGEDFSAPSTSRSYARLDENVSNVYVNYKFETEGFWGTLATYKAGASSFDKSRESLRAKFNYNESSGLDTSLPVNKILSPDNFDTGFISLGFQTSPNDLYLADEKSYSFYGSGEWNFDDIWIASLGLRSESFQQILRFPESEDPETLEVDREETNILPALNVTWKMRDKWQWRLALSQTISRPGIVEINSSTQFDPDTDQIIVGNPNLEQSDIINFDLKTEYYFSDVEKLTFGLFFKDIDNPIEKSIVQGQNVFDAYTFRNSLSASLFGFELEFEKNIFTIGDWESSIFSNLSWIDSEVTLDRLGRQLEAREKRALQGQSEYLFNLRWSFEDIAAGHNIALLLNYFDDRIDVVDKKSTGDRIEKGRIKFDATYSYSFDYGLIIDAKIKNITNEDVVFSSEGASSISSDSYSVGREISLGISYSF